MAQTKEAEMSDLEELQIRVAVGWGVVHGMCIGALVTLLLVGAFLDWPGWAIGINAVAALAFLTVGWDNVEERALKERRPSC
jgi:hypothetical protein